MRTIPLHGLLPLLAAAALFVPAPARALGHGPYTVEILVDGAALDEVAARGRHYVEALPGREYAIRMTNHTAGRIAIALSVDGLNTIDARTTTAAGASKWVLGPYESVTIEGWQTSGREARRFFFTTEARSYGAWIGRTQDLGLVSAAVFREKRPERARVARPEAQAAEKSAPAAESRGDAQASAKSAPAPTDELAATGIGRPVDHAVERVAIDLERRPAAVLELRYEYRDALVRLGVLPRDEGDALDRRERARGFTDRGWCPVPR